MQNRNHKSAQLALCGIVTAFAIVLMTVGGIFPFATYVIPAFAGLLLLPVRVEYGTKAALAAYAATSILTILLAAEKEMAAMFVCFLGYYPALAARFTALKHVLVRWAAKLCLFNAAIFVAYGLLLVVFPIPVLQAEFAAFSSWFAALLLLAANVTFVVYDKAVHSVELIYRAKWRKQILKLR